ncbi:MULTISPECIES: non-ribosomal peptide synthetase [unclassified Saccharopolyspora]|uniref:non-ribosomal peptide synthetase n=1 Tax=unclassified Saccharopolyspora TaxID=2646250 RepID=UPI001CD7742E|nr:MULTISPECIES: non-ribosomal peptide synthetase [unclassified Saccharopolyspora]MCA1191380.1 non-ribosomal peptide synthetase [Saccharopolyspora sp. 6V]MCA1225019.1 non-ribosomal peptide synthetase [Saccharopolyspora sp. 6M]
MTDFSAAGDGGAEARPDAARCHALSVRLAPSVEHATIAARLAAVRQQDARRPAHELWVQRIAGSADDPIAERIRRGETARGVSRADGLRVVLLQCSDAVELVLVAHRARYTAGHLRDTARSLAGESAPVCPASPIAGLDEELSFEPADWGLGTRAESRPGRCELPVRESGSAETWIAALSIVLDRYGQEATSLPVVASRQAGGGCRLVAVSTELSGATQVTSLLDGIRSGLDAPEAQVTTKVAPVGFIVDRIEPEHDGAVEYEPCLAPTFPVTLSFAAGRADGGVLRCDHDPRWVSPEIAHQLVRHVVRVHDQIIAHPSSAVREAEILGAESARVLALGTGPSLDRAEPRLLHDRVRARAAETPGAIAITEGPRRITYQELDDQSDRWARALRALGVRRGARVGVCLDRSAEIPVVLLAVLKAGGVYVPMEPAYPRERLAFIAEDAELALVVTRHGEFPTGAGRKAVSPEALSAAPPADHLPEDGEPADPAYVIYTSGSTGRPKGVVVPHGNICALLDATSVDFGLGGQDVWTWFHSCAFDFSVWEIWGCLATGGGLVVVPYWVSRDPERFLELLGRERVTVLSQTPSAFAPLAVDQGTAGVAPRLVVFGGEPLDTRMLVGWFDRHPESRCRVVNMFGITETTVHVTVQTVTRRIALEESRAVGRPLPGWSVSVRDEGGRVLPLGVPGEIYVGGAGVAARYLNRPDLTEHRFVLDQHTGQRVYRSGDRGRLRPDGVLEHLGRLDHQVKIRGFRIELDEIRSVLLEDPAVSAAAVVVNRTDPDDAASARLDGYVVTEKSTSDIRARAARLLPEHMVPATVSAIPAMPLTANGKLDQQRLPAPHPARPARTAPDSGGSATMADALRVVWSEVLGVEVTLDDDFFELGGNSLFAVRITTALRERGVPAVPLRDLYRYPTIRQLSVLRASGGAS